ncbi:MAG: SDR family NAD(P)-dependent oxidoreductase [Pseudomonadota bacterium]
MPSNLSQKQIVLTGATDGIGLATAWKLEECGANVLAVGRRTPDTVALPPKAHYLQVDLSDADAHEAVTRHLANTGWTEVHHLIHNAGLGYVGPIERQTADDLDDLITVNLTAPIALTTALFPHLERAGGSVCFVGSTIANRTTPNFAAYSATKTALSDLAQNLDTEWRGKVRVQEVNPGPTRTNFHAKAGFENPPLASLFMTQEEVADGIIKCLETGARIKNYGMISLAVHAIRRRLRRHQP